MAKMYPRELSEETPSAAERKLYEAFRDGLDDCYTVFHSVAWQAPDKECVTRDGEADFVIAHPERGVLVVEAKGGGVRHGGRTRQWASVDRNRHVHAIPDPFAQARSSKYVLHDAIKGMLRSPQRWINIGHAVAFPDVVAGDVSLGLDKERAIILDATDLASVSAWVGGALAYWRGKATQRETGPGEEVVRVLVELLARDWELRPALWGDVAQEQRQFIRLTEEQFRVLDTLSRHRSAAVCGCAGSGKTMLAAEKAVRLARQDFRVLLTCFNRNLAAYLRAQLKHRDNLDIIHFHRLCMDLARKAHVEPERPEERGFFSERLPNALLEAIDVLNVSYDAIVVDEGQDFLGSWWTPLEMLLKDQDNGILYIFYDDNQRIYDRQGELPVPQSAYPLTVNCRNTQHIHGKILLFYDCDARPTALGPQGRPVEIVEYGDSRQVQTVLASVLRRLQVEERLPADQIVVLTPLSRGKSKLWTGTTQSSLRLTEKWPAPAGQVCCSTIHAFKGLEASVVVLAEVECLASRQWTDADSLLYVACSRACSHLIVLLPDSVDARLREVFTGAGKR